MLFGGRTCELSRMLILFALRPLARRPIRIVSNLRASGVIGILFG